MAVFAWSERVVEVLNEYLLNYIHYREELHIWRIQEQITIEKEKVLDVSIGLKEDKSSGLDQM